MTPNGTGPRFPILGRLRGHLPFPAYGVAAADGGRGRWLALTRANRWLVASVPAASVAPVMWPVSQSGSVLLTVSLATAVFALSRWFVPDAEAELLHFDKCVERVWVVRRSIVILSVTEVIACHNADGHVSIALRDGQVQHGKASETVRVARMNPDPVLRWRRSSSHTPRVSIQEIRLVVRLAKRMAEYVGPVQIDDLEAAAVRFLVLAPRRALAAAIELGTLRRSGPNIALTDAGRLWLKCQSARPGHVVPGVLPSERSVLDPPDEAGPTTSR